MWLIKHFIKNKLARQFVKFCIVGGFNTVLDYSIYLFLSRVIGIYYLYANIASVLIAMTSSFILNKYWTFRNNDKQIRRQYLKFIMVNVVYFILNNLIVFVLVNYWQTFDLLAKAVAVFICLFWNFFANRYWTFKKA